jgi:hypothetical protein
MEPSEKYRSDQTPSKSFILYRVYLVGYIRPSWTFSLDSKGLAASLGRTYSTPGQIYPASWIYPVLVRF